MTKKALIKTTTKTPAPAGADDIDQLVLDFKKALALRVEAGELAQTSATTYTTGLDKFLAWSFANGQPQTTPDTIRQWKADLLKTCKPGAVNTWLTGVRALYSWAVSEGRLNVNPTTGLRGAKRTGTSQAHKREALTDSEVLRVLAQPDTTTAAGKRDLAILAIMAYTGARTIELQRADLADLKTQSGRLVLVVQGKGRTEKDRLLVLVNPAAEAAIMDWLAVRGDAPGALFAGLGNRSRGRLELRTIRNLVKGYYAQAGVVGNKTTHSLRHTAITSAVRAGAPVQKVQAMAGHANVSTTMIYFHETDRIENPAEAFVSYKVR